MIIERKPRRHPRQGPSCLLILIVIAGIFAGGFVISNAEEVRTAILPQPTATPTRTAATNAARGRLYTRDGEIELAIASYEEAIRLDNSNPDYYTNLVRLLVEDGSPIEAREWADKATEFVGEDNDDMLTLSAATYLSEGDRLTDQGERSAALESYAQASLLARSASDKNPENAEALAIQAAALVKQGPDFVATADSIVEGALLLDEFNPTILRHAATVKEYQGLYSEAAEMYEIALDETPNSSELLVGLARTYWAQRNIQEAIVIFKQAIDIDPENADALDGIGYMYFLIGEYPQAQEWLEDAVDVDNEMVRAHAHLGATHFRRLDYDAAIPELEEAVSSYKDVSGETAIYFNMLGLAYFYTTEQCTEAQPIFEQVITNIPNEDDFQHINAQEGLRLCREAQFGG